MLPAGVSIKLFVIHGQWNRFGRPKRRETHNVKLSTLGASKIMLNECQFNNDTVVCTFYGYDVRYGMQIVYD